MNGVVVGEYAYDTYGRRVKKVASGVTTLYHYAGGNLIAETDGNGVTLRDYIYLNGEPAALRIYGAQFGTMYYFVNDHLGTPQKIADSTGQVVWAAAYLPFGKAQVKPETVTNNLRFPGQYFDAESGLHYNWHRYYDPETGRYITADPIGLSGGINLYAYVMGNPMGWIDPSGLSFWGSFGSGVVVGIGTGALVVGTSLAALSVGVPATVITTGLFVVGAIGGITTVASMVRNPSADNIGFNLGAFAGGFMVGSVHGRYMACKFSPPEHQPPPGWEAWNPFRDIRQIWQFNTHEPVGVQLTNMMETGPNPLSASGAVAAGGSGLAIRK